MAPLLLVGLLPALVYLPDPLVTGDHPWMVRRLVPAVIPLLAIAASAGAGVLWHLRWPRPSPVLPGAGPLAAVLLVGLGLGIAIGQDRDFVSAPHGSGLVTGLTALADGLPNNAVVIFPTGQAGIHLAMPLDLDFGVDAFNVPGRALTPTLAAGLARMEAIGRSIYWAEDGPVPPILAGAASAESVRAIRIHYQVADNGGVPPPLQLRDVDHDITLYRLHFPAP
jgi:hypothetical protein